MQRAWQVAGTTFAILFAFWAYESWHLSLTDALGPGPGFFPFWLSVLACLLSIILVVQTAGRGHVVPPDEASLDASHIRPHDTALRQIAIVLLALTAVTALLETLGFRIVIAAFCLITLPALGARNWLVILLVAALASFGVYAVFSDILKVPLPVGVFES